MARNNDMDFETIVECMFGDDETKVDDEYQTDAVKERVTDDGLKTFADAKQVIDDESQTVAVEAQVVDDESQTVVVEEQTIDEKEPEFFVESHITSYEEGIARLNQLSQQLKELGIHEEIIEACEKRDLNGLKDITEKYDKEVDRVCKQMDQIMKQMPYPYSF